MKVPRIFDSNDHITPEAVKRSATRLVPRGSVLVVTRSGILRHSFPVAVAERDVALNQDLKALIPSDGVLPEYVAWALRAFARSILHTCTKSGTTVQNIETAKLIEFEIPVAPISEQQRIVAAIEEHLSRLDAAEELLHRVRRKARRLRAALLTKATASYEGVELGRLATDLRYGTSLKCTYEPRGLPVLRIPNIKDGCVEVSDLKFASDPTVDLSPFLVIDGDLLFVRTNGSRDLIGRVAVVAGAGRMAFASYLVRVRLDHSRLDANFAALALSTPASRALIESKAATTAGQYNLNLAALRSLPVPLPPLDEQRRVVAEVDRQLSIVEVIEAEVESALRRTLGFRRSVLRRAFKGELVPEGRSDAVASVLLERAHAAADVGTSGGLGATVHA
jgi:type I restriction enzyme S subunit